MFSWPDNISSDNEIDRRYLSMMLEGVDISQIRLKRRFGLNKLHS
jgi:hypothetical protein